MAARFPFSWGDIVLNVTDTDMSHGRQTTALTPAVGDGGATLDSGPVVRSVRAMVAWVATGAEDASEALARRDAFLAAVADGKARLLVHDIDGEVFPARVGTIETNNSTSTAVMDSIVFLEDRGTTFAPADPNFGIEPAAGATAVQVAADNADAALAALGASVVSTQAAADVAQEWADRASETDTVVDSRRVEAERDEALDAIQADAASNRLDARVDGGRAAVAMRELEAALRLASVAATTGTAFTERITLATTTALLGLCARIDPANALTLYEQARALQRIDNVAAMPAGTTITIPRIT